MTSCGKIRGGLEFLAAPVTQVPPFPLEVEYTTEIDGTG